MSLRVFVREGGIGPVQSNRKDCTLEVTLSLHVGQLIELSENWFGECTSYSTKDNSQTSRAKKNKMWQ